MQNIDGKTCHDSEQFDTGPTFSWLSMTVAETVAGLVTGKSSLILKYSTFQIVTVYFSKMLCCFFEN